MRNSEWFLMWCISGQEISSVVCQRKDVLLLIQFEYFCQVVGGTGECQLIKTIYQAVSKELLYHAKDPDKPCVLLLGPTGVSAVNIGGTTIHPGLGIKPGPKLLGL